MTADAAQGLAIPGLHHVTAISGPPQANLDFYVQTMRRRLVKRTVNFDDPGTYHLYYGNAGAEPGSILTFFPFPDAKPGRAGPGMASAFAYAVPDLAEWSGRLAAAGAIVERPWTRFGERGAALSDPDRLRVELIEGGARDGAFHSVTLWVVEEAEPTAHVLDLLGYVAAGEENAPTGSAGGAERRLRFQAPGRSRGAVVDLVTTDGDAKGRPGAGRVHHVAFRAPMPTDLGAWRERLAAAGLRVTPVINRQYFDAIYFRTPGGILFEIATDPPGFEVDEAPERLGEALRLPPRYEPMRVRIEATLPPLVVPRSPE